MRQRLLPYPLKLVLAAVLAAVLIPGGTLVHAQQAPDPGQILSPNQLDDMVAPIALYPDPLITQILVAATYPLEVVEASQWIQRNPSLTGRALTQEAERQDWDPSIQALVPFPDVLKYLTEDIAWTTGLGNAFLAQESDVLDAVQRMRDRASRDGKLVSNSQQVVTRTVDSGRSVYVITPAEPDIIYVPVYDPYWIWGTPYYYPYARWYYPPHVPVVYFNRGISVSLFYGSGWQGWSSWGWRPQWTSRTVVVNNSFIYRQNFNSTHLTSFTGTTTWIHDGAHRQGVPYPTRVLADRFHGPSRDNMGSRQPGPVRPVTSQPPNNSPVNQPPLTNQRDVRRDVTNRDRDYNRVPNDPRSVGQPPPTVPAIVQEPARRPYQDRPVQNQPAQDRPVQNRPVQDRPVQNQPAQDRLVQNRPVQDRPVQNQPVQDRPVQNRPAQDRLVQNRPVQDRPVQNQPVQDRPVQNRPAQDRPVQNRPAQDRPVQSRPAQDRAALERLAPERQTFREPSPNRAVTAMANLEPTRRYSPDRPVQERPAQDRVAQPQSYRATVGQAAPSVVRPSVRVNENSPERSAPASSSHSHGNDNAESSGSKHSGNSRENSR